eukprot:TRINITY_DN1760_c1_g1_i2.p1 TRINITY_DN1760_c1_g1~~TRINITY_DN1760_c1_g1_i2.p1  ORF type:complete len:204 (+),score=80.99 TRINITY_DN1760_c1_g1_i2:252-863(+)
MVLIRTFGVDWDVSQGVSGLLADARQLVNEARGEASDYRKFYKEDVPGKVLCSRVSNHVQQYTLHSYTRPYGCSALIAAYDWKGPTLYMVDPSGVSYGYFACAIGKAKSAAKAELEKLDFESITCEEAVKQVAKILEQVHDDIKDKDYELEMSWVCDASNKKHQLVPKDIKEAAMAYAEEALKEEDSSDDDSSSDDSDEDEEE